MYDPKIKRRKLLKFFYDKSQGNSMNPIPAPHAIKHLRLEENEDEYYGIEKYLSDKTLIKKITNVDVQITDQGIDEVEADFPILGGEIGHFRQNELLNLHTLLTELTELRNKGLLRIDERDSAEAHVIETLSYLLPSDSISGRMLMKHIQVNRWKDVVHGHFTGPRDKTLEPLMDIIQEAMNEFGVDNAPLDKHISADHVYQGRKVLRDILSTAQTSIDIQDNWMSVDVLEIIEPYIEINPMLNIRLLSKEIGKGLVSDLKLFEKEYKPIPLRVNTKCHNRYIIIDSADVFDIGASLKDLGKTAATVKKIEDSKAVDDILRDYEEWWKNSNTP